MSKKAERRTLILKAAERLLEHYGVGKTTVADIAREASIGVGTVYLEFGSKDDIIERVASRKHEAILERLQKASARGETCSARLCSVLDERLDAFLSLTEGGTHACDLIHCDASPVESAWGAYRDAERELIRELVAEGVDCGEFEAMDVERAADTILRAYISFSPPWVFRQASLDTIREHLAAMHRLVIDGLRKR